MKKSLIQAMRHIVKNSHINEKFFMILYVIRQLQLLYFIYDYSDTSFWKTSWISYLLQVTNYVQVLSL